MPVASIAIPEKYLEGMQVLLRLSKDEVQAIVDTLSSTEAGASTRQLSATVSQTFTELSNEQVYQALTALRSLYSVYTNSELSLKAFIKQLIPALEDLSGEPVSKTGRKAIVSAFESMLGVTKVAVYAKMQSLSTGGGASFCKARINTDLRPVFINGEDKPRGFMLVHRLQLGFHREDGEHQDFFISMDEEDLQALRHAVDEAERKYQGLQATIEKISY
jgi:hypothetical protein